MYIRKKSVAAGCKLAIGIASLAAWWYLLLQNGCSALRLFPTWVLAIAAVYFVVSAIILALSQKRESGENICPMLEGMILMGFFLASGVAIASAAQGFFLPELPTWAIVLVCGILPLLVLFDWVLFVKKGRWQAMAPFYWLALPVCYAATMIFTAELVSEDAMVWRYPLPLLDYLEFGLFDMLGWMLVVALLELAVGYVLFLLDFALSGKLAQRIVLPHIRTVVIDETGAEKTVEAKVADELKAEGIQDPKITKTSAHNPKKPKPAARPNPAKPKPAMKAEQAKPEANKIKDSELIQARNHRETHEKVEKVITPKSASKSQKSNTSKPKPKTSKSIEVKKSSIN